MSSIHTRVWDPVRGLGPTGLVLRPRLAFGDFRVHSDNLGQELPAIVKLDSGWGSCSGLPGGS